MKKQWMIALLCALWGLTSCSSDVVYSEFVPMAEDSWHRDSLCTFSFHISDASQSYQMIVYMRHKDNFPLQNIWLSVEDSLVEEDSQQHNALEYYMANDRGQWLGQGKNGIIEMPMLYEAERLFPDTGDYTIRVKQMTREELLVGVQSVGLVIKQNGKK